MFGHAIEQMGEVIGEAGILQAVDHQVHAQGKHHDLPGRLAQHSAGGNSVAVGGNREQQRGTDSRYRADGDAQGFQDKQADQQQKQRPPAYD
ncbi:hypothetical protein D3C80_1598050 [compost metagenome]